MAAAAISTRLARPHRAFGPVHRRRGGNGGASHVSTASGVKVKLSSEQSSAWTAFGTNFLGSATGLSAESGVAADGKKGTSTLSSFLGLGVGMSIGGSGGRGGHGRGGERDQLRCHRHRHISDQRHGPQSRSARRFARHLRPIGRRRRRQWRINALPHLLQPEQRLLLRGRRGRRGR